MPLCLERATESVSTKHALHWGESKCTCWCCIEKFHFWISFSNLISLKAKQVTGWLPVFLFEFECDMRLTDRPSQKSMFNKKKLGGSNDSKHFPIQTSIAVSCSYLQVIRWHDWIAVCTEISSQDPVLNVHVNSSSRLSLNTSGQITLLPMNGLTYTFIEGQESDTIAVFSPSNDTITPGPVFTYRIGALSDALRRNALCLLDGSIIVTIIYSSKTTSHATLLKVIWHVEWTHMFCPKVLWISRGYFNINISFYLSSLNVMNSSIGISDRYKRILGWQSIKEKWKH